MATKTGEASAAVGSRPRIDLNGTWAFRMDPQEAGEKEGWHSAKAAFDDKITVPGAWQAQGFGEPDGIVRHNYLGTAWYRKTVRVPADWQGKAIRLKIDNAHRRWNAFVDGKPVGSHDSFFAPGECNISQAVRPGEENVIAIRVENPAPTNNYRDAPDKLTQGLPTGCFNTINYWGGIYGAVELEASDPTRVESVYVTSDIDRMAVRFQIEASGGASHATVLVPGFEPVTAPLKGGSADIEVGVAGARLWSPDNPHLYTAQISLLKDGKVLDRIEERVGIRTITTQGKTLLLNGKPFFLRGYGDDNVEVLTGFGPSSHTELKARLELAKSLGFNGVRFHSSTPSKAFFDVADEVGVFVMAELPVAYTTYVTGNEEFLRGDLEKILMAYRNRPSLMSLALGNELDMSWIKSLKGQHRLAKFVKEAYQIAKSIAPQTLILSTDGADELYPTDMLSMGVPDHADDVPTMCHEFGGYYCSLPDISLIDRFTGAIDPVWLYEKKAWVDAQGLVDTYPAYVKNSQRLQKLGRKFQIERARRDPFKSGYHYWLMVDWPGGTGEGDSWEEGWLNFFWEPKEVTPAEGQQVNSAALLMIDAGPDDRVFTTRGGKSVHLSVSNFGDEDMRGTSVTWKLVAEGGSVVDSGTLQANAPMGQIASVGEIALTARPGDKMQKLTLHVETTVAGNTYTNQWDFWAVPLEGLLQECSKPVVFSTRWFMWNAWADVANRYPFFTEKGKEVPKDSLLTTTNLDAAALAHLEAGGSVWFTACRDEEYKLERSTFFPSAGGCQGVIVTDHPALRGFLHDGFCDHQFHQVIEEGWYWPLDDVPVNFAPIIGGIRTKSAWLAKTKDLSRFGFLFEAKVGKGKLLVSTLNLFQPRSRPGAMYLFDQLLRYAVSPEFAPEAQVTIKELSDWGTSSRADKSR